MLSLTRHGKTPHEAVCRGGHVPLLLWALSRGSVQPLGLFQRRCHMFQPRLCSLSLGTEEGFAGQPPDGVAELLGRVRVVAAFPRLQLCVRVAPLHRVRTVACWTEEGTKYPPGPLWTSKPRDGTAAACAQRFSFQIRTRTRAQAS